jgi:hypothetical protein
MEIEEFGAALIKSGDLDPIYVMLGAKPLPSAVLSQWLVAYWCFYHAGVASYMADQIMSHYWREMEKAAANVDGGWPRGAERRHFRGALATSSMAGLRNRYMCAEYMVQQIAEEAPSFQRVFHRAMDHRGFGPWIAFKIADMLERCCGVAIDFDQAAVFMFKDPAEAVDVLWQRRVASLARTKLDKHERRERVISQLLWKFAAYSAPGGHTRPVGIQEIETILCKWKSHLHGRYPVGKDTIEIRHALEQWAPRSPTAARLIGGLPA